MLWVGALTVYRRRRLGRWFERTAMKPVLLGCWLAHLVLWSFAATYLTPPTLQLHLLVWIGLVVLTFPLAVIGLVAVWDALEGRSSFAARSGLAFFWLAAFLLALVPMVILVCFAVLKLATLK